MDFCFCLVNVKEAKVTVFSDKTNCWQFRQSESLCKLLHGANSPVVALRCPTSEHTHITLPILLVVKYDRRLFEMIWHYRCTVNLALNTHYRITIHPASFITHHIYYMPHATYYIQTTYCTNSSSIIFIYHFVARDSALYRNTGKKSLISTALALPWVSKQLAGEIGLWEPGVSTYLPGH